MAYIFTCLKFGRKKKKLRGMSTETRKEEIEVRKEPLDEEEEDEDDEEGGDLSAYKLDSEEV